MKDLSLMNLEKIQIKCKHFEQQNFKLEDKFEKLNYEIQNLNLEKNELKYCIETSDTEISVIIYNFFLEILFSKYVKAILNFQIIN